jgi:molecular chaperone HscB
VTRRLTIDQADLERRFRDLSRRFHPDYFYNAPPAERLASLERSSYLNDAYRTLRSPMSRIEHLLAIEGLPPAKSENGTAKVPPALLEEVFTLNEELDDIRQWRESGADPSALRGRLESARRPIEEKREQHEREVESLCALWDRQLESGGDADKRATLEALLERLLERNYINNLLAAIDRETASLGARSPEPGVEHRG